jgi:methyl-accepting chemotaxis protein
MEKVVVELEASTKKAEASLQDVVDAIKEINKETTEANENTEKSLKGVEEASKKTSLGVKGIGTALKAAGIGLAIAAFAKLSEIFNKNQKVADAFGTAFEFISIALNDFVTFVIDNTGGVVKFFDAIFKDPMKSLKEFGEGFKKNIQERFESSLEVLGFLASAIKKVFSGDFKGAMEDVKNAGKESLDVITGVNDTFDKSAEAIDKVVGAAKEYAKETLKAAKSNVELEKSSRLAEAANQGLLEKYDRQAEQLRQIRGDDSKSFEERIKANEDLG